MRPVRAVGLYLAFVFGGGALLAPWLFSLVQAAAASFPELQSLAAKPFPRFLNRSFLVLALAGLVPFLRAAGLCSWNAIGLHRRRDAAAHVGWGFVFGFVSLACIVMVVLACGARQLNDERELGAVLASFAKAALTAALVGTMEEIVFRGAVFGSFRRRLPWVWALILSSAIYALLHFLERGGTSAPVNWASGFVVLGGMVAGFTDMEKLIPGFLNLTIVGAVLALAYHRTGSLYFSIGLHAGWIFWLKTYGFITEAVPGSLTWFFGTNKLVNGWLAFIVLAGVLVLVTRFMLQPRDEGMLEARKASP